MSPNHLFENSVHLVENQSLKLAFQNSSSLKAQGPHPRRTPKVVKGKVYSGLGQRQDWVQISARPWLGQPIALSRFSLPIYKTGLVINHTYFLGLNEMMSVKALTSINCSFVHLFNRELLRTNSTFSTPPEAGACSHEHKQLGVEYLASLARKASLRKWERRHAGVWGRACQVRGSAKMLRGNGSGECEEQ